jgi:hypothetical protein
LLAFRQSPSLSILSFHSLKASSAFGFIVSRYLFVKDHNIWSFKAKQSCGLKLLRKEVIQPHLPIRLPCYDFTPITSPTFDGSVLAVRPPASGVASFRGVTGGVYKARERIHRGMLIRDY